LLDSLLQEIEKEYFVDVVMDTRNIFWGLVIKPGKRYETEVQEPFRITKACIEPSTSTKGKVTSVMVECDNSEEFIITNLSLKIFNESLDLSFNEGEKICFKVEGPATVHLTGNLMDPEEASPEDMFEHASDSDEVEESEEEDVEPGQKRKKNLVNGQAKKSKKTEDSDEEEDDDDDDGSDDDDEDDTSIGDTTADTTAATEGSDDSEDDDEDDEDDEDEEDEEEKVESPKKDKAVNGTATPKGENKKKPAPEETPKQAVKPSKQEAKTPKQEAKTPKQEAKTPKQEAKTPKQEAKTQKEGDVKTPKETKTPKQDPKTPKEESKTPKEESSGKTPKRTLKGGVQVEDVKEGTGPECKSGNMVGMYYEGRLKSNNKRFDGLKEGKPFKFKLGSGQVIKGWDVGVLGMKVGGKRKLTIPPKLGYGASGAPPDIPPNSTLVFEIECKFVK